MSLLDRLAISFGTGGFIAFCKVFLGVLCIVGA